jgi:hypothetical protein
MIFNTLSLLAEVPVVLVLHGREVVPVVVVLVVC